MMIRRYIAGIVLLGLVAAGCAKQPASQFPDEMELAVACDSVAQQFTGELKGELMAALSKGSAAEAVEVCKVIAPEIAAGYSKHAGWDVSRISDRPRNPDDTPSQFEAELLGRLGANDSMQTVHAWETNPDGDSTFYFLRAIRISEPCLQCHGDPGQFSPEMVQTLGKEYPDDQATGYQLGDFRGAVVVAVTYPEGAAALTGQEPGD